MKDKKRFSFGMFLVTIGIVYGDIGTSPLYVMKSIIEGNGGLTEINEDFIIGSLSLIIWTVTLLTTVKYVLIALRADHHGEGGIFSLYSLVKQFGKALIIPAMIGGAALLADGLLTPAVTVTTAVEGLRSIPAIDRLLGAGQAKVVIIVLVIILTLFAIQSAGTSKIGKAFGPCMLIWFTFLAVGGICNIPNCPSVLKAFNPIYAVQVLLSPYNKLGFMILGSVFLATTGAEALYSDMGHVGRSNIYASWPFVKVCLILNYLGQGAWVLANRTDASLLAIEDMNPFFMMLPQSVRPVAILLGAMAAIIASQALITGSYTLVSEAIRLDLMPHMEVRYPSETKGQIYIGLVNTILCVGCTAVVLYFRSGSRMESAYGLAITLTMLMTTVLLSVYLGKLKKRPVAAVLLLVIFGAIETVFFISSLSKFLVGGYITVIIAALIFAVMFTWYRGTQLENQTRKRLELRKYIPNLKALHEDSAIPYTADNIIYLEKDTDNELVNRDILYSILDKDPKRAKAYWFMTLNVTDEPDTMQYRVENFGTDFIFAVQLDLGFKMPQTVNVYLRQIVNDMVLSGELPPQERKYSIYGPSDIGTFKFCNFIKQVPAKSSLSAFDAMVLRLKYSIRHAIGSKIQWYGLDTTSQITESVPLVVPEKRQAGHLTRK